MMTETIQAIKLQLSDPQVFSEAIGAVSKLVDEVTIKITPTHLEIVAMDPANVAMVVLKMESRAFMEYSGEGNFSIKLASLKQVLARNKGKEGFVSLTVENNQLKVLLSGKTRKEYTLPLIELEQKQTKMPELKFAFEVSIDNMDFRDSVADVSIVADSCEFKVADNQFVITGVGDSSKAISETKGISKKVGDVDTASGKYSIEYLDKMLSGKFKTAKLFIGTDYPIKIVYVSETGTTTIEYLLAPRIDGSN